MQLRVVLVWGGPEGVEGRMYALCLSTNPARGLLLVDRLAVKRAGGRFQVKRPRGQLSEPALNHFVFGLKPDRTHPLLECGPRLERFPLLEVHALVPFLHRTACTSSKGAPMARE